MKNLLPLWRSSQRMNNRMFAVIFMPINKAYSKGKSNMLRLSELVQAVIILIMVVLWRESVLIAFFIAKFSFVQMPKNNEIARDVNNSSSLRTYPGTKTEDVILLQVLLEEVSELNRKIAELKLVVFNSCTFTTINQKHSGSGNNVGNFECIEKNFDINSNK
jgi:hypothetical protein